MTGQVLAALRAVAVQAAAGGALSLMCVAVKRDGRQAAWLRVWGEPLIGPGGSRRVSRRC